MTEHDSCTFLNPNGTRVLKQEVDALLASGTRLTKARRRALESMLNRLDHEESRMNIGHKTLSLRAYHLANEISEVSETRKTVLACIERCREALGMRRAFDESRYEPDDVDQRFAKELGITL